MIYYLFKLSQLFPDRHAFKAFDVFQYITLRALGAALTAFLLSLMCGNWVIRRLISLKLGQPIRTKEEVNKLFELHGAKAGTPTMGGVLMLGAVIISSLVWARPDNVGVWLLIFTLLYCGGLGFWDDYLKVSKKNSAGVSEQNKLVAQGILAIIITAFFLTNPAIEVQAKAVYIPFSKAPLIANLGIVGTLGFFALVIVGSSNAVNLTDGLDGLAAGCTCTAAFAYAILAYVCGHVGIATYLQIPFYPFAGELTVICMALVGASFGFLWFNCHPAKVFMGDTGSLAIGGMLGVTAICTKQEMLLVVVGGVFVIEAVSVLIQRTWFKITKKRYGEGRRVFLMSPLHHHFELKGWKENTVIVRFWTLSIMFAFLGLVQPSNSAECAVWDESFVVLGAGESGESAARLLKQENAMVTILDTAEENKLRKKIEAMGAEGIRVIAGIAAEHESLHGHYDRVILSPGIDPAVPLVQNFIKRRIKMIGELELAYEMCKCPIIGITGTNGETTTTQLVEKMLTGCGVKTVACGNIGPAFSAKVRESKNLDVMTVEISSFQLETIERFRCETSVWLGFAPDHLDRYHSMDEYYAAKVRIFENQTAGDWAVINLRDKLPELKARQITFSAYVSGADFEMRSGAIYFRGERVLAMADTKLRGSHNAENLMASLGVGFVRGLSFAQMVPPLCEYQPLPHRCEILRTVNGVEWVNDSKGTNPDSVEKALHSETRPVVLIAGGKDKGFEYDLLTELVAARCRATVVMGEMADRIETIWKSRLPVMNAGWSLEKAVKLAHGLAQPGDVVLFSPGTSSFDMFKNYADRGNQFRALVQALPS